MTIEFQLKRRDPEEIINILSEKLMLCMAKSQERKRALELLTGHRPENIIEFTHVMQVVQKALED